MGRRGAEPANPPGGVMVFVELRPAPELALVAGRAPPAGHPLGIERRGKLARYACDVCDVM